MANRDFAARGTWPVLAIGVVLSLAGCAGGPDAAKIEVQAKRAPTHGYVEFSVAANDPAPFQGQIAGANCEISNSDFSAHFQTPATVDIPLYGYTTKPVKIACEKAGHQSASLVLEPIDADLVSSMKNQAQAGAMVGSAAGLIPVVGLVAGPIGRAAGAHAGAANAAAQNANLSEEERRTHNYTYYGDVGTGSKTAILVMPKVAQ